VAKVKRTRLELIAVREVIVIIIIVVLGGLGGLGGLGVLAAVLGVLGGVSGSSGGRNGSTRERTGGGGRNLDLVGDAKDLADVDVAAVVINLGVVGVENSGVQAVVGCNILTGVISGDSVSGGAVFAGITKAELASRDEVSAVLVDDASVNGRELVS
jgi:hypothetical protein